MYRIALAALFAATSVAQAQQASYPSKTIRLVVPLAPGGPPHRPGLIRRATGGGGIEVEIWAVPLPAVGSFLAGIPAPLGLGRVLLADGTSVCGFVCEAIAAEGAEDITALGSWRAWLKRQA